MKKAVRKTIIILGWILIWQIIAVIVHNPIFFVGPVDVIKKLINLVPTLDFWHTIFNSFLRITGGFLIAFFCGYYLARVAFRYRIIKEILAPLVTFFKAVPVASIVVVLLIWFGSKWLTLYITFMVVFPNIYINMLEGLSDADDEMLEMACEFNLSRRDIFRYIYRPAFSPSLRGAVKVSVGMAFKSGVAAEIIGLPAFSIGERIYGNKIYLETDGVFAWTAVIIVISVITEKLILAILQRTEWASYSVNVPSAMAVDKMIAGSGKQQIEDIVLDSVTGRYGDHIVIKDFTYTFRTGDVYCVMGESGRGKTTLLNMIAAGLGRSGRLFQEDRLCSLISGLGNVVMTKPMYTYNELVWYFTMAGLKDSMHEPVFAYSGGMKRRVALLRTLLAKSDVLLLDEPFAGLDEVSKDRMIDLIMELKGERPVIVSTHDSEDVTKLEATLIKLD